MEHYESLEDGFIQFVMEAIDRLGAAYSLECRHPFFDRNVMEFCLSLPPEQKLRRGWTRWIMRQAMCSILPQEVQWRPGKTDLSGNFRKGIQTSDKNLIEEVLFIKPGCFQGYVNLKSLQEAYTRYRSYSSEGNNCPFWAPVNLALWLKGRDQRKRDKATEEKN
jgi:asparagine synthase (glutamine-hydrolysing)